MRYTLLVALLTLSSALVAHAQESLCPNNSQAPDSSRNPDLVIRASATVESIRFETQPRMEVRLTGCAVLDTVRVLERRNLPDPVQPGVTYRNVYIATEILGYLDIECLLDGIGGPIGVQPAISGAQPGDGAAAAGSPSGGRDAAQGSDCGTVAEGAEPEVPPAAPDPTPAAAPSPAELQPRPAPQGQTVPAGRGSTGGPQGMIPHPLKLRSFLAFSIRPGMPVKPPEIERLLA